MKTQLLAIAILLIASNPVFADKATYELKLLLRNEIRILRRIALAEQRAARAYPNNRALYQYRVPMHRTYVPYYYYYGRRYR